MTPAKLGGVLARVAFEMLGHGEIGITMDRRSHIVANMRERAAAAMEQRLFG